MSIGRIGKRPPILMIKKAHSKRRSLLSSIELYMDFFMVFIPCKNLLSQKALQRNANYLKKKKMNICRFEEVSPTGNLSL